MIFSKKIIIDKFILRKPKISDSKELFLNYASDINVAYYTTWQPHKSIQETKNFLRYILEKWKKNEEFNFIIEKDNNILGLFKIVFLNKNKAQIGYALGKKYWGKGYMTMILKEMINYLFSQKNIKEIQAFCDVDNIASKKVMIKSGMKFVKLLKNFIIHPNISEDIKRNCLLFKILK